MPESIDDCRCAVCKDRAISAQAKDQPPCSQLGSIDETIATTSGLVTSDRRNASYTWLAYGERRHGQHSGARKGHVR